MNAPTAQAPTGNVQTANPNATGRTNPTMGAQMRVLDLMRGEFSQIEQAIHANHPYHTALDKLIEQAEQLRQYDASQ